MAVCGRYLSAEKFSMMWRMEVHWRRVVEGLSYIFRDNWSRRPSTTRTIAKKNGPSAAIVIKPTYLRFTFSRSHRPIRVIFATTTSGHSSVIFPFTIRYATSSGSIFDLPRLFIMLSDDAHHHTH